MDEKSKAALADAVSGMSEMLLSTVEPAVDAVVANVIADLKADTDKSSSPWVKIRNNFYIAGITLVTGALSDGLKSELSARITKLIGK